MNSNYGIPVRMAAKSPLPYADTRGKHDYLLLVEREHNYYDDSDSNFLYFDNADGMLKKGVWTTRGYCGDNFYDYPSVLDAPDECKEKIMPVLREFLKGEATPISMTDSWWFDEDIENYNIPCEVVGGRKFQGEGVLSRCSVHRTRDWESASAHIITDEGIGYANPKFVRFNQQALMDRIYGHIDSLDFGGLYRLLSDTWDLRYSSVLKEVMGKVLPM